VNTDLEGEHPVNLGNPRENTIGEIATMVRDLTGSASEIVYKPLPVDDPVRRRPDISRARELLGWEPTVALADGLRHTIDDFSARFGHS
jgi:UDP-glucuronate decarboxylase